TGLNPTVIVMGAGFVEFCLAFVLIFGRLASQVAAVTLLSVMISAVPVVGILDLIGHLPILVVLIILAATRNPIGRIAPDAARRGSELNTPVSFVVSVPGFIAAYYLGHVMAYGALKDLNWADGLLAGLLLVLLIVEVVRTAPDTFRQVCSLNEPAHAGARGR